MKDPVWSAMSHSQTEKKQNITGVLWAVMGIVLRVSITGLVLIWPFRWKRQFCCPSGCPVNSISKGQKSNDCGLDEKQKCTISFLSPGNGDHSELGRWPSLLLQCFMRTKDGTHRMEQQKECKQFQKVTTPVLRGHRKHYLSSHVRSAWVSSHQIHTKFYFLKSGLCETYKHFFFFLASILNELNVKNIKVSSLCSLHSNKMQTYQMAFLLTIWIK